MAPQLLGPTRLATCSHCDYSFPVAAETYRSSLPTRCRQCGGSCLVQGQIVSGERVTIEPAGGRNSWPRLELIAFQDPTSGTTQVKRIWGLPGERITMRGGEVYLADQGNAVPRLLQKTLEQLMQVCVPVTKLPPETGSSWQFVQPKDQATMASTPIATWTRSHQTEPLLLLPNQALQWAFHRPAPVHSIEVPAEQWLQAGPMVDDYEGNQGVSCRLNRVDDYLLWLELQTPLDGEMNIYIRCGTTVVPVKFCELNLALNTAPDDKIIAELAHPGQLVFQARRQIKLAWCDQRLLVETDFEKQAIDLNNMPSFVVESPASEVPASEVPAESQLEPAAMIRIEANTELRVKQISIARDLYFEDWDGPIQPTTGYFVMGDNLPISIDSRGELGRIAPQQIVGRVKLAD